MYKGRVLFMLFQVGMVPGGVVLKGFGKGWIFMLLGGSAGVKGGSKPKLEKCFCKN